MVSAIISRLAVLGIGTLYPAYQSYKAVKTKNAREYVKWMMYWIVFAIFTCTEVVTDIFVAWWLPFYYELKMVFIIWLLAPQTRGSSFLYRKFIHPTLNNKERDIDEYLAAAKDKGYSAVVTLGARGLTIASQAVMSTAVQGQTRLLNHLRRSYSLDDIDHASALALEARSAQPSGGEGGDADMLSSEDSEEEGGVGGGGAGLRGRRSYRRRQHQLLMPNDELDNRLVEEQQRLYHDQVIHEAPDEDAEADLVAPRGGGKSKRSVIDEYREKKERAGAAGSRKKEGKSDTMPRQRKARSRKPIPEFDSGETY